MPVVGVASFLSLRRVVELVSLRYRLQWAQIRGNTAAIVTFAILLLVFVLVLAGALLGGMGVGALSQPDRAGSLLRLALGATFLNLLLVSVVFGFGTNQIFSERTLRRFPLGQPERVFLQYGIGLFEPTWLLALAVYLGCALGASVTGVGSIWYAIPAAVLLIAANYAVARLVMAFVERLVATAAGSLVLLVLMQSAFLIPMAVTNEGGRLRDMGFIEPALGLMAPVAAAALMTGAPVWPALAVLAAWLVLPLTVLVLLDRRPLPTRSARGDVAKWDSAYDRAAAMFPRLWEPLVGRALRYYLRSPGVRVSLIVTLPVMGLVLRGGTGSEDAAASLFSRALVFAPIGASMVTAAFATNAFGYDASGLRRLLLCPVPPGLILRTLAVVPLMLGTAFTWVMAAAWMAWRPVPTGPGMLTMLIAYALTGMLVFNAILLWPSVLAPRRVPYDQKFRNEASFGGQVGVMGGMLLLVAVPMLIRVLLMGESIADEWWWPLAALPLALVFYVVMLFGAERALARRREPLVFVVEGRS